MRSARSTYGRHGARSRSGDAAGFAYLWMPVTWARGAGVLVVLSIALARQDDSRRWKQVAHPSRRVWMHHLEVRALADLDEEVRAWLAEAYADAG